MNKRNFYKNQKCLIIDESGNLGTSGRYFVIACIETKNYKSLHNIMKRKLQAAKQLYPNLKSGSHEVKAANAFPSVKHHILESIATKDIKISYIVADLFHIEPRLLVDKNILYNYLVKLLLQRLISSKDIGSTVNILCDNKTTKVASTNSMSDYIKTVINYEQNMDIDLNIRFMDSDSSNAYVIQAADYVANALYSRYEHKNILYSQPLTLKFYKMGHFPYTKFGK